MISGITITCFAASYTVAFALELSRLVFRSAVRSWAMLLFAAAGVVAHTLFLAHQAFQAETLPLARWFDWYLVAAWVLAIGYLYISYYHRGSMLGLLVLPLVLGLIAVAWLFRNSPPFPASDASQIWGLIHGAALLLGTVVVLLGFVAGIAYLIQAVRLKRKIPPTDAFRLPSLEALQRINEHALVVSALCLTVGLLSGIALNAVLHGRGAPLRVAWRDPVVYSSALLLVWLVSVLVFNVAYRPARQGRKVAYLTVASFIFLLLVLTIVLFVPSTHPSQQAGSTADLPQGQQPGGVP